MVGDLRNKQKHGNHVRVIEQLASIAGNVYTKSASGMYIIRRKRCR